MLYQSKGKILQKMFKTWSQRASNIKWADSHVVIRSFKLDEI